MSYAAWVAIGLMPYWLGPILVWLTQKVGAHPVFEVFSPGKHAVPADVAAAFRQTCDALVTEGFHPVADLFQTSQVRHVSTRVALLENDATAELALAVAMFTAARPARLVASYVELPTKLRGGRSVTVNNSARLGAFRRPPSCIVVQLPDVRDPARLCRIKRAYLQRHYGSAERVPFDHQHDPARFLSEAMVRELTDQVDAGAWRLDEKTGTFRPTFISAWRMTWQALPPFSLLRRRRVGRRAAAILNELGMDGPDPRPITPPRTRLSVAWLAAFVVAVALLTHFGSSVTRAIRVAPRSDPITLPADFVVPDAFPDAVRTLERLPGTSAAPLVGTASLRPGADGRVRGERHARPRRRSHRRRPATVSHEGILSFSVGAALRYPGAARSSRIVPASRPV
jgi:hypothetical protein